MRIAFVHPDLGIGGAERLIVDCALAMKSKGHQVCIFTSHHDPEHSFVEGNINVIVYGDFIPRNCLGYGHILFSILKGLYLALAILFYPKFDVFVVDQLSAPIPILKLTKSKILFYCHFPDKLLTARTSYIKFLYRLPFDVLEELTTWMADEIVVNSGFTRQIFATSFRFINNIPKIVYPALHTDKCNAMLADQKYDGYLSGRKIILSINRFERKKCIELAINTFAALEKDPRLLLVVAGGYDKRVSENVEYLEELVTLCSDLSLEARKSWEYTEISKTTQVLFLPSIPENLKYHLLKNSACLIYTPSNEHFGIVPLEAMYVKCPVIACNSGGPKETIINGETGFLCEPNSVDFSNKLAIILQANKEYGKAGHELVLKSFSLECLKKTLHGLLVDLNERGTSGMNGALLIAFFVIYSMLRHLIL